ncbi:MAG: M48 family metallopeptidase [Deferribacterales bacterium]
MIVKYGNSEIEFTHIINPKLKRMSISIDAENRVVVKTPKVSSAAVLELVYRKADWILKKQATAKESLSDLKLETGASLPFLGNSYCLKLEEDKTMGVGLASLSFSNSSFTLKYNPYLMKKEYMHKALDDFYKSQAKEHITTVAVYWADIMKVRYSKITFKKTSSRWGSCSSKGNIMFNYELIKLPIECIEYIVVHELAHLRHLNHSKDFWKLVEEYLPNYKEQRDRMRSFRL